MRRRLVLSLSTVVLLIVGLLAGATPANAASYNGTKFYFTSTAVDTYAAKGILRGSGSAVLLSAAYKYRWRGSFHKPKFVVQQYTGKKWVTVKHVKTSYNSTYGATARIPATIVPAGVPNIKVKYRFKSLKSKSKHVLNSDTSKTITISYDNQAMYVGLAAQVYANMAVWCPTAAVRIDPTLVATEGAAGVFQAQKSIAVDPSIAAYPAVDIQAVSVHECAHMRQFYNYGGTYKGWEKAEKAAAKVFFNDINPDPNAPTDPSKGLISDGGGAGFNAIEHGADCSQLAVTITGYLGYGGYCNPTEILEGAQLLNGFKY